MALPPPDQKLYNPHAPYADPKSLRGAINYQGAPGKVMTKVSNLPGFRHLEQGLNKAGIKTSATATTPVPEGYTSTAAQAGKGVKALRAVKDVGLGMLAGAGIQAAASGFETSTDDYSRRMGWRPTGVKAGSDGSLAAALTDPEFYRGLGHRAVGVATDVGRHAINAIPNTVGLVTDTVGLTKNLRDYDYGKNNFADLQAAPTPVSAKPSLRDAATTPAQPGVDWTKHSLNEPMEQPLPAPASSAAKPSLRDAFGAPAGTTVATVPGASGVTRLRDATGRTTYTDAKNQAELTQRGTGPGVSTVPSAGVPAPSAPATAAPEGPSVAVIGGDPQAGQGAGASALRDLLNDPRKRYRAAAAQALAGLDAKSADRASEEARTAQQLNAQSALADKNNQAQSLRDAAHFQNNLALKGIDVSQDQAKALRDWWKEQYNMSRNSRADARAEEAHYTAQQNAVADDLANLMGSESIDDKGRVTRTPDKAAAQALLAEYANAPADLQGFRDESGNVVPFQHLDKRLQKQMVDAYQLRQSLGAARGKTGVAGIDALPTVWDMVTNPAGVSVQPNGDVKVGAGKVNSATFGGSSNVPYAGISEAELREIQKRARALNGG